MDHFVDLAAVPYGCGKKEQDRSTSFLSYSAIRAEAGLKLQPWPALISANMLIFPGTNGANWLNYISPTST